VEHLPLLRLRLLKFVDVAGLLLLQHLGQLFHLGCLYDGLGHSLLILVLGLVPVHRGVVLAAFPVALLGVVDGPEIRLLFLQSVHLVLCYCFHYFTLL
jgi:hypothetical protein